MSGRFDIRRLRRPADIAWGSGYGLWRREAQLSDPADVVDLNDLGFIVDLVEDPAPARPQAPDVRRPVGEGLSRPRLVG